MREKEDDLIVFGHEGQTIPIGPTLYKRGQRLVDATLVHVPSQLEYDAPPDHDADES